MRTIFNSMRHHYMAIVSIFLIAVALITGTAGCGCPGTISQDLDIYTWEDLNEIRNNLGGHHTLMTNLNSDSEGWEVYVNPENTDGKGWEPIGTRTNSFKGTFDGNKHTISDLLINRPDEENVGLFGFVYEVGLIKNVGLVSVNVTGKKSVGALVGYNWKGTLDGTDRPPDSWTYSSGSVTGEEDVGGLVGNNYGGKVKSCESSADVFHVPGTPDEEYCHAGGLVGLNSGTVENCNYNGVVTGDCQVGGLVGFNEYIPLPLPSQRGLVEDCGGNYSVKGNKSVGGVVGESWADIIRTSFKGTVNGTYEEDIYGSFNEGTTGKAYSSDTALPGSYVGGVVGKNMGTVEDCKADGVTVEGYQYVGGLAGANGGNVTGCSSSGNVTGTLDVGQFVGYNTGNLRDYNSNSCVISADGGCGKVVGRDESGTSVVSYNLYMAADPVASGDAIDVAAKGAYAAGVSVSIKAVPAAGYQFVNWTADPTVTFGDEISYETTFTMPAQDITVTAHFVVVVVGPLDHFNCYLAVDERAEGEWGVISVGEAVYLEGQFGAVQAEVGYAGWFFSPVEKRHDGVTPISNPAHHLTMYSLDYEEDLQTWFVEVDNQFGTQELIVEGPVGLAVPTQKEGHEPPVGLDHFLIYSVIEGSDVDVVVGLEDQFGYQPQVLVSAPVGFGIPVQKTHEGVVTEIEDPEAHLVLYEIEWGEIETKVQILNQFGAQTLDMGGPLVLAVPSEKMFATPF